MGKIADEYPNFMKTPDPGRRLETWTRILSKVPKGLAECATTRVLIEHKYNAPNISDIIACIKELTRKEGDDATSAWHILVRAVQRSSIMLPEEYNMLPYEIKRFAGGISGLIALGMIEESVFETVTRANFSKTYESLSRAKETEMILNGAQYHMLEEKYNLLREG